MTKTYRRAELLPNGFVRVDCTSGLVRMYELRPLGGVHLRSGNGCPQDDELAAVRDLLVTP